MSPSDAVLCNNLFKSLAIAREVVFAFSTGYDLSVPEQLEKHKQFIAVYEQLQKAQADFINLFDEKPYYG